MLGSQRSRWAAAVRSNFACLPEPDTLERASTVLSSIQKPRKFSVVNVYKGLRPAVLTDSEWTGKLEVQGHGFAGAT